MERSPDRYRGIKIGFGVVALLLILLLGLSLIKPRSMARIAHADPELQAAVQRAQSELKDFEKELSNPTEGEGFAVKGAFKTDQGPEYLWVRMPTYENGVFRGRLDQVPEFYKGAKKGDEVSVKEADVFDWLIKDKSGIRGAYTEQVLQK